MSAQSSSEMSCCKGNHTKRIFYHVSDGIIEELTSRRAVEVSHHPEGHRTDVAIVWQKNEQRKNICIVSHKFKQHRILHAATTDDAK